MKNPFFCSIIIPTIGRSTVDRAVMSVLEQDFSQAEYEIVVVNDSGTQLPKAEWQSSPQIRVLNTNRHERSIARNSGAAVARGKYLGFLDDDDWYLPEALEVFWQLAESHPGAAWLYGGIQVIDHLGNIMAELNSELEGNCFAQIIGDAWVPLQASLIKAQSFFETQGFNPAICGTEDEDLCRKIAYLGDLANTKTTVACLFRGRNWSTSTNYMRAPEDRRVSRNFILSEKKAFSRLMDSAKTSYWFGRIFRVYASLSAWNMKKKVCFTAFSRGFYCLLCFIHARIHVFTKEFWDGFRAHHVPNTLHFVMKEYETKQGVKSVESSTPKE